MNCSNCINIKDQDFPDKQLRKIDNMAKKLKKMGYNTKCCCEASFIIDKGLKGE